MVRPYDSAQGKPVGATLLWVLAGASILLLLYEAVTLTGSVVRPLLANPLAIQTDFHYYYDAAIRFAANRTQLYNLDDHVIAGFAYPPPAILPFWWLSGWPLGTAFLAFTIASYLVLLAAVQQWLAYLRRHGFSADRPTSIALVLIALALGPTYMNAIFGQVNGFVLAAAVAFVSLAPTAALEAAVVLALGTWLKVYPILLAAIGLWDRRTWRALAGSIAAAVAIALAVMTIIPPSNFATFFFEVLPSRIDSTAIHISNQSLVAFLERFRYPAAQFLIWTGDQAVTVGATVRVLNLAAAGVAIVALWRRARDGAGNHALNAATLMALIAVIAPLGWGHTYMMVLPLVLLQLIAMRDALTLPAIVIFSCVLALMVPAGRRFAFVEAGPDWLLNLIYSRYLLATLVLAAIPSTPRERSTGSTPVASA